MKVSIVFLVLLFAITVSAATAAVIDHTGNVTAGWNMLALAGIPLDPDPTAVFGSIPVDTKLYRLDAATQSMILYDVWTPDIFGNMLLTDGYWLLADAADSFTYSGLDDNDSMDVWISLPVAGWTLMGNPFSYDYTWANAKVTDGNITVSMTDASRSQSWLSSIGYWFDNNTQSMLDIGIPDDYPSTEALPPWHGMWVQSNRDKIALIFESTL